VSILKIAFGLPAYGGKVSAEHTLMFLELGHTLALSHERFQLAGWFMIDNCGIEKARNRLLREALDAGADWLLMIDADTWAVNNGDEDAGVQLLRMISQADKEGATIVGAPVIRRYSGHDRFKPPTSELMVYDWHETKPAGIAYAGYGEHEATPAEGKLVALAPSELPRKLTSCDALATAIFAVNIKKAGHLNFKFTDELSEDLYFCHKVKEEGGKILVDGRVRTAHLSRPFSILYAGGEEVIIEKT
jgi:hypothetical protein